MMRGFGFFHKKDYPLHFFDFRELSPEYNGVIHVWDVDKTYLDTHFSSVRGMARIPVEFSVDKRAISGMPEVLRGLRWGTGREYAGVPLFFVTASPSVMQGILRRKMVLDGVEYDGLIMKDWASCVAQLRPGRLREQLGFKICALLTLRTGHPNAVEYLYGDDTEADAVAYSLYADLLDGNLRAGELEVRMKGLGIRRDDRRCIFRLLDRIGPVAGRVETAFIHLESGTPPKVLMAMGNRVIPVRGAGQLAMALFERGLLTAEVTKRTISTCRHSKWQVTKDMLQDAIDRGLITLEKWKALDVTL